MAFAKSQVDRKANHVASVKTCAWLTPPRASKGRELLLTPARKALADAQALAALFGPIPDYLSLGGQEEV